MIRMLSNDAVRAKRSGAIDSFTECLDSLICARMLREGNILVPMFEYLHAESPMCKLYLDADRVVDGVPSQEDIDAFEGEWP